MKALVLCGGLPQVALIQELKSRGIYTVLADMNEQVIARQYADKFYAVSVLDVDGVERVAKEEKVDFVITACADQVLQVQAEVSEKLGLPCYISNETAKAVSSKELMKKTFVENGIPTAKHVILDQFDLEKLDSLRFPLIVKPVDSYSSRGVRKVYDRGNLEAAFENAIKISRTGAAIIEEYVSGEEITVDVYVENGNAHILCISNIDKIPNNDRFVICRTRYPAVISERIKERVSIIANQIATAFELKNSPMLIQLITNGEEVSVVEFCARTGGGDKFRLIEQVSGFDVIKAVVDLTLGNTPHVEEGRFKGGIINEFLYAEPGVFDHIEGFKELKEEGLVQEYYQLKAAGTTIGEINSSGDRVAYYTIQSDSVDDLKELDKMINSRIRIVDRDGRDILRHDLVASY